MTNREILTAGDRVLIVRMTNEDQPTFQQWLSENAELRELIADHRVPTMEDQHKWFARAQEPDRKLFSIVTMEGELIGNGGFVDIDLEKKQAQFRITIGHTDYLGKGFGTEATRLIVRYGMEAFGFTRIYLHVLPTNERAIKSYEKVGFVRKEEYTAPSGQKKILMELDPVHFVS